MYLADNFKQIGFQKITKIAQFQTEREAPNNLTVFPPQIFML